MLLLHTKRSLFVEMQFFVFFNGLFFVYLLYSRILRSAQIHNASLKPAYPGSLTACTCGYDIKYFFYSRNVPHYEFCPMHDIYDSEKACQFSYFFSCLVLYHPLKQGDRVVQGPDWQWGSQGLGVEGTVIYLKKWKDSDGIGVLLLLFNYSQIRVLWDDGCDNVYRYGAENAFDVIELCFFLLSYLDRIQRCEVILSCLEGMRIILRVMIDSLYNIQFHGQHMSKRIFIMGSISLVVSLLPIYQKIN